MDIIVGVLALLILWAVFGLAVYLIIAHSFKARMSEMCEEIERLLNAGDQHE